MEEEEEDEKSIPSLTTFTHLCSLYFIMHFLSTHPSFYEKRFITLTPCSTHLRVYKSSAQ
jgi:hypothetical protein